MDTTACIHRNRHMYRKISVLFPYLWRLFRIRARGAVKSLSSLVNIPYNTPLRPSRPLGWKTHEKSVSKVWRISPVGRLLCGLIRRASILRTLSIFTRSFFSRHPQSQALSSRQPVLNLATRRFHECAKPIDARSSSRDLISVLDIPFENRRKVLLKISTISATETIEICPQISREGNTSTSFERAYIL